MKLPLRSLLLALTLMVASTSQAANLKTPVEELFTAVSVDNVRDTRRLLQEHLVDPKIVDEHGDTVLIVAIRNDSARVIDYLLADKATDVETTNVSNETPLMIAAFRKRKDVVQKLLARDAEVNRVGWTALHYAASVDARDVVALLLDNAAYIDAESPNKTTPLMMAARGGFDDLCHQLIDAGADPTVVNERDLTASDFAKRVEDMPLSDWLSQQAVAWRAKYGTSAGGRPAPAH
jgi:ankyrin repeat protein